METLSMPRNENSAIVQVPAVADIGHWTSRDWTDGVQVDDLAPLDRLVVRTRNNEYDITVMTPGTGEVLVQGGRFFPEPVRVRLAGASLGGSFLKLGGIYVGLRMEVCRDGETVITSAVQSIDVVPSADARH
jgi:hypothetical protein